MSDNGYTDELERALARSDADVMSRQIDAYIDYLQAGAGGWPEHHSDDFSEITMSGYDDPEKALAYIAIAVSRTDDPQVLAYFGCGQLEDILRDPSSDMLERIVVEARKSARFRWLLSNPFKVALSERAWEAIEKFRITGPHEEPSFETLPPR